MTKRGFSRFTWSTAKSIISCSLFITHVRRVVGNDDRKKSKGISETPINVLDPLDSISCHPLSYPSPPCPAPLLLYITSPALAKLRTRTNLFQSRLSFFSIPLSSPSCVSANWMKKNGPCQTLCSSPHRSMCLRSLATIKRSMVTCLRSTNALNVEKSYEIENDDGKKKREAGGGCIIIIII